MENEVFVEKTPKKTLAENPLTTLENIKDAPFFEFHGNFQSKVCHVYDGDTIHCILFYKDEFVKIRVRMYGYDSPELKPSKNIEEAKRQEIKKAALEAKQYISDLILGKVVYLEVVPDHNDKYGRILGVIRLNQNDKRSVNSLMIKNGHGYPYFGGKKNDVLKTEIIVHEKTSFSRKDQRSFTKNSKKTKVSEPKNEQ